MGISEHMASSAPSAERSDHPDRATSALVLGFRFFALAAGAGIAALLPTGRVQLPLFATGVLLATGLGLLQHRAMRRGWRRFAAGLIVLQVATWTLLIHATGGRTSPLIVGYLFELSLTGALFGGRGIAIAVVAATALDVASAWRLDPPLEAPRVAARIAFLAAGSLISAYMTAVLRRQRATLEQARRALTDRAVGLAEHLRMLGDSLSGALIEIDELGRVVSLNPAGTELLGREVSDTLGRPWQEVLDPDPESRSQLLETLESGVPRHRVTMALTGPPGRSRTVQADMWLSPSPGGGRRTYVLLDPTAPPTGEDPVRRLGESAACVAHQIKNSVHVLQGLAARLDREAPGEPAGGVATSQYLEALRGLGALAEDVLAMGGGSRPAREALVIQDVLQSAATLLRDRPIRVTAPRPPLHALANRSQLVHALFNLLDNAVRVSPPGRPVEVRAENRGAWVVIEIADAGPGLATGLAAGDRPVESRCGAGLGLMAARRFVENSGGHLSITSVEGRGTRCELELPAAPAIDAPGGE